MKLEISRYTDALQHKFDMDDVNALLNHNFNILTIYKR